MIIFSLGFTFSLASVPGEETGIDSLSVTGPGAVQPVRSTRGFTVSIAGAGYLFFTMFWPKCVYFCPFLTHFRCI